MKELLFALYVRDDLGIHWSLRILRASCIPQIGSTRWLILLDFTYKLVCFVQEPSTQSFCCVSLACLTWPLTLLVTASDLFSKAARVTWGHKPRLLFAFTRSCWRWPRAGFRSWASSQSRNLVTWHILPWRDSSDLRNTPSWLWLRSRYGGFDATGILRGSLRGGQQSNYIPCHHVDSYIFRCVNVRMEF